MAPEGIVPRHFLSLEVKGGLEDALRVTKIHK